MASRAESFPWCARVAARLSLGRWMSGVGLALAVATSAVAADASPPPPGLPTVGIPSAVDRVLRSYERAWKAKDTRTLAGLFHPDGLALANGSSPARGHTSIEAGYAASAGGDLLLRPVAFEESGRLAYVAGLFAVAEGGPELGKFVLVLRKADDGRWLILADMDNANVSSNPRP